MPVVASPESQTTQWFDALAGWLQEQLEEAGIPGAAIGVVMRGERLTKSFGMANVETNEPITDDTAFRVASLTKVFTATALAALADRGAFDLEAPVVETLDAFRVADPAATAATTTVNLLSHSGGWADTLEPEPGEDALDYYVKEMHRLPQVTPVGTALSYNNSGFLVAGHLLEVLTGRTYEEAIQAEVLGPLGLDTSGFTDSLIGTATVASGHVRGDNGMTPVDTWQVPRPFNPAGGLIATIDDLLTFVQAHAELDTSPISAAALTATQQGRIAGGSMGAVEADQIGLGWWVLDVGGETVLMSQGGDEGLATAMAVVPAHRFGIVVLTNGQSADMLVNEVLFKGIAGMLDIQDDAPEPIQLSREEAVNLAGTYETPDWLKLTITTSGSAIHLVASAAGEPIPGIDGDLTMVSARVGYLPYLGGKLWVDFVRDSDDTLWWVRFFGRLASRLEP